MPFPLAALLTAVAPAAVTAVSSLLTARAQRKSEQSQYQRMLEYNAPKNQMARFKEAGLSPYLMYSQGSSGNVSSPAPGDVYPDVSPVVGKGIEDYMSIANFEKDMRLKDLQITQMARNNSNLLSVGEKLSYDNARKQLDLLSDYPDMEGFHSPAAATGFRRKVNELKVALSKAQADRLDTQIEGMKSRNIVDRVKATYASEYGMVGGDWTQGLGLIKSFPSFFRGARKAPTDPMEKAIIDRYRKMQKSTFDRKANRYLFEQFNP